MCRSSRSSTPPILAPLDKQERVSPTPVSGPAHIAATVKPVPVPVTSQGTDVPAAAQAEPRQPPPPPPRPSRQSVTSDPSTPGALRVQRTSSIMSVSSGLGSPDIRPLEVIEDMTCPEGEIACVDLITCFHQCGIVPDVLSAEQLAALLTLACGYGLWLPSNGSYPHSLWGDVVAGTRKPSVSGSLNRC
jgi:hypothetical protein